MADKSTKAEANYRPSTGAGRRCDNCTMWRPPESCTAVKGKIEADAVCDYFKRLPRR